MGFCVLFSEAEIGYLPEVPWLCDKLAIILNIPLTALFHLMSTDVLGNFLLTEDSSWEKFLLKKAQACKACEERRWGKQREVEYQRPKLSSSCWMEEAQ